MGAWWWGGIDGADGVGVQEACAGDAGFVRGGEENDR